MNTSFWPEELRTSISNIIPRKGPRPSRIPEDEGVSGSVKNIGCATYGKALEIASNKIEGLNGFNGLHEYRIPLDLAPEAREIVFSIFLSGSWNVVGGQICGFSSTVKRSKGNRPSNL